MVQTQKLTNLQLELIKMFQYKVADHQLIDIKNMLSQYFAEKATEEMDRLWEENNWSNETMEVWSNEHFRSKSMQ
jgi:hypothetical protein